MTSPLAPCARTLSGKVAATCSCLGWCLAALGLVLLWAGVGIYAAWSSGTKPDVTSTLHFTGLHAPVTVVREASGVVHIQAADDHDVAFAQVQGVDGWMGGCVGRGVESACGIA